MQRISTSKRRIMAVAGCAVLTVIAAPVYAAPWQWQIGLARGVPGGFIQVREHSVSGTALPLGPALGMDYVQRVRLAAVDNIGRGRAWVFKSDLARLYGETMLPTAAYFNGVELAEDKPLTTSASWLNNWQFTALYRQALVVKAAGA